MLIKKNMPVRKTSSTSFYVHLNVGIEQKHKYILLKPVIPIGKYHHHLIILFITYFLQQSKIIVHKATTQLYNPPATPAHIG